MVIPEKILHECHAHGVEAYPEETCGFILGNRDDPDSLETVLPMRNIMNELHEEDPEQYPRTARDGYMIDPREQMKLERSLKKEGKEIKVIYHSHPDVGAYFSEKDKEDALWNGKARYPGITFLVCATTNGKPDGAILADFNENTEDFEITTIPPDSAITSADSLGGTFGITGILPTINFIHEWKNGSRELEHGYFRFVPPRQVKDLQRALSARSSARHALAYCSGRTALFELLIYLRESRPQTNLYLPANSTLIPATLQNLEIPCHSLDLEKSVEWEKLSAKQGNVLLLAMKDPETFLKEKAECLGKLRRLRVPVIIFSACPPIFDEWPNGLTYWVSNITTPDSNVNLSGIEGGVILSNADRQIAELTEMRKRSGPILSARNAAVFLEVIQNENADFSNNADFFQTEKSLNNSNPVELVSQKLSEWEHSSAGFLFPSGMSAVSILLNLLRKKEKAQVIVIGLLYSESYALLMSSGISATWKALFLRLDELDSLPEILSEKTAMIITETITNPLGEVPDLEKIGEIANAYGVPLVVDNTLASPANCQPLDFGVDYVIHSTTKFLSGSNDHAGGAVLVKKPEDALSLENFQKSWELTISPLEAEILWVRMQDFKERMERFNTNGTAIAHFLAAHSAVDHVYHASLSSHLSFSTAKKLLSGNGGVVSFTLKDDSEKGLRSFYDKDFSSILKAPTIGSNQTLICPYPLLTHYFDTDAELEEIKLPRHLIRVAAGCETEIDTILADLNHALKRTTQ